MQKFVFYLIVWLIIPFRMSSQVIQDPNDLPAKILTGKQGKHHIQGMALDKQNGYIYFSFTDRLVKMDLSGNLIGSVTGLVGHLGDLDMGEDGKIYGSLEYKNDAIGKGITKDLAGAPPADGFYVAIFDGKLIKQKDMNAEKEDVVKTVYIREAVEDYTEKVNVNGKLVPHRHGCSGIDGLTFAPAIGKSHTSKKFLYVAYGIYGDNDRNDNNHQVILKYDVSGWDKYAQKLSQNNLHHSGPKKPDDKYFVKTGNTRYGIQNLAFDQASGNLYAAVYKGSKPQFPNYDLFVIDGNEKPKKARISVDDKLTKVKMLLLLNTKSDKAKPGGWRFDWGSTGLCPIGNGLFYISHNEKTSDGQQQSTIHKYRWVGNENTAFEMVK